MNKNDDQKTCHQIRHCALCLQVLNTIKVCAACRRRAYCSRECQILDWSATKGGQGHKNWCSLSYGEEDLDWKVVHVDGKGFGLIALRDFEEKSRILVDALRSIEQCLHLEAIQPALADLMPLDASLEEKFDFNALDCGMSADKGLCLRISRVNHDCSPNAGHYYDNSLHVKILFAEKYIKKGEEICFSYQPCGPSSVKSLQDARTVLSLKWGINCPSNCCCRDEIMLKNLEEVRLLDNNIFRFGCMGQSSKALKAAAKLLSLYEESNASWIPRMRTHYDAFQVAIVSRKTLKHSKKHMKEAYSILSQILSPKSKELNQFNEYLTNPASHRNYLALDRQCN